MFQKIFTLLILLFFLCINGLFGQYKAKGKYYSIRDAFEEPELVTELELSSINSAIPDSISKCKHLKIVRLINLNASYDLGDAFRKLAGLDSLRELYLFGNKHNELPEEIGMLKKLKKIQLNYTISGNLPKALLALSKIDSLEFISLRGFGITELPKEIVAVKGLKSLNLADNPSINYEQAFELLAQTDLERLILDFNFVQPFPKSITVLKKLKYLDMKYMISDMDKKEVYVTLAALSQLRYLSISSNHIDHFPKELGLLDNLSQLDISENNVSKTELEQLKKELPATKIICTDI